MLLLKKVRDYLNNYNHLTYTYYTGDYTMNTLGALFTYLFIIAAVITLPIIALTALANLEIYGWTALGLFFFYLGIRSPKEA